MSELSTLARPYAEAVFRLAREESDLATWSQRLQALAAIAADPQMARLIADPVVDAARVAALLIEVAGDGLGARGANFVHVLAENDRLALLPAIASRFDALRAEAEGTLEAVITGAQPLTPQQAAELVGALEAKFQRTVSAKEVVDPDLIGGVVIAIGDQVIDGSVKGRLQRMAFALHD